MHTKVKEMVNNLQIFRSIYSEGAIITVIDADSILQGFLLPDGMPPLMNVGDPFEDPSGGMDKVLRTKEKVHNVLPKEVMGSAFEGDLIPILDDSKVVGVVTATYPVDEENDVTSVKTKFTKAINDINDTLRPLFDSMEKTAEKMNVLSAEVDKVKEDTASALKIVSNISSNSSRSNILALNASIEAARSGEAGRGFAVVATEMGKLANDSSASATAISDFLNTTNGNLNTITSSLHEATEVSQQNIAEIGKIKENLSTVRSLFDNMDK